MAPSGTTHLEDGGGSLVDRIAEVAGSLSPAQSRVARFLADTPSAVAFGTVAEVAAAAQTSAQTVLRLAGRLGHDGFPGLQDEVRAELVARLPPAADRIRQPAGPDVPAHVRQADEHNLARSLDVGEADLATVVSLLADPARTIGIVAAESWTGVGQLFGDQLSQLRERVRPLAGSPPRVVREVGLLEEGDVVVALDVRRYERWVVDAVAQAAAAGVTVVAITDSPTSPLCAGAAHRFVVGVASPGPFESATGVVALLHLLVTEVAHRSSRSAQPRLDAAERAWADQATLLDP